MKSIRKFILIAIGMLAFTVTASTTAKLEHKQKVESVNGFEIHKDYSQVVNIYKEIQISQELSALEGKVPNLRKVVNELNPYTISQDVGWRRSQTIKYTIRKEKLPLNYLTTGIIYRTNIFEVKCRDNC